MLHFVKLTLPCFLAMMILFSCQNNATPDKVSAQEEKPKVDTIRETAPATNATGTYIVKSGIVYWMGRKATGDSHNGSIQVLNGTLEVQGGKLVSGSIVLDMNSVAVADLKDPEEKRDLESHLKDSDFFETKKYPKAEFKFSEVYPSNNPDFNTVIAGSLTMKAKTKAVNIPVIIKLDEKELTAESATFPINRTDWGVNFRAGILGTAKDQLINDVVTLSLSLKAKKKE